MCYEFQSGVLGSELTKVIAVLEDVRNGCVVTGDDLKKKPERVTIVNMWQQNKEWQSTDRDKKAY